LLKDPSFAVFVLAAFLFCIPLNLYFSFTPSFLDDLGIGNIAGTMTLGQCSEIVFMLVMPFFLARLGIKWVFALGMLGWAARYLLFYLGYQSATSWPLYLGVGIHGMCYVFFFVLAYIYVDKKAPELIRTKAQGFISLVTLGAGFLAGGVISGGFVQQSSFPNVEPTQFKAVADAARWAEGDLVKWEVNTTPAYGKITKISKEGADAAKPTATVEGFTRDQDIYRPSGKTETVPLSALSRPMVLWSRVWSYAALSGAVILALFTLLFRHKEKPAPTTNPA
jgi:MFS family permease